MVGICINDRKCRNLLTLGEKYELEPYKMNKNCYSVKLKNNVKAGITAKKNMAFKKDRFVIIKK